MTNLKTTFTGIALAILIAIQPLTTEQGFNIKKDWLQLLIAASIAFFGVISKDADKKSPKE